MNNQRSTSGAAIVTGASRGLGRGIAQRLAASGRPVVLAARDSPDLHQAAAALGDRAFAFPTDVTAASDVTALAEFAHERFGAIDLLVNNAGAPPVLDPLETLTTQRFSLGFEIDVCGTLAMTQAVAPGMLAHGAGTIVNLIAARGGTPAGPAHLSVSPSQAALASLTRCLARILAPGGVTVHGLLPALTPSGATGRIAAPALGVTFDGEVLTGEQVGEAIIVLLDEPDSGDWSIGPDGLSPLVAVPA